MIITSIAIEHIHKDIARNISSAPKEFRLFGYTSSEYLDVTDEVDFSESAIYINDSDEGLMLLAAGTYIIPSEGQNYTPSQRFPVDTHRLPIRVVKLFIESNYGNNDFTCLYRLKIHGTPVPSSWSSSATIGTDRLDSSRGYEDSEVGLDTPINSYSEQQ